MSNSFRTLVVSSLVLPLLAACATKGYVRERIATERLSIDSTVVAERDARMSSDASINSSVSTVQGNVTTLQSDVAQVRQELAQLRSDLATLRNDFDVRITAMEKGLEFAMPVTFGYNVADVDSSMAPALHRFASVAKDHYGSSVVTVEGFTDPAGSATFNKTLSTKRANAVKDYLVNEGLAASNVRAIGYGETRLVVPGASKEKMGADQNRRVVFVIETSNAAAIVAALNNGGF